MSRVWYLAARKLSNDISLEELQELEQILLHDPHLASQLEMHSRYFNADRHKESDKEELARVWNKIEPLLNDDRNDDKHEVDTGNKKTRFRKLYFRLAVCLVIGIAGIFTFLQMDKSDKISAKIEANDNKYQVILPDGSKVTLNKKSHIDLSDGFGKSNRNVTLEGEAFFEIAHNAEMPFVVSANCIQVKVLGTVFNMRAYKDEKEVQTSLVKGMVKITDLINKDLNIVMKPNEKVTVHVVNGDLEKIKGIASTAYEMQVLKAEKTSGIIPELAWTEDKLIFNDEPLQQIVKRFEKWYNVTILIQNDALKDEKFTAIFQGETIDAALTALQISYPFKFHKNKNGDIVIDK